MRLLHKTLRFISLLAIAANSASAFEEGAILPIPELVQPKRFSLKAYELKQDTQIVIFYYSASWCGACKKTSAALSKAYPKITQQTKGIEFITYPLDFSPRARADYLRKTRFAWPAISPEVINSKPWLSKIPGGTPQFQAFVIEDQTLIAITAPGSSKDVLTTALNLSKELKAP